MNCPKCGKKVKDEIRICPKCGATIKPPRNVTIKLIVMIVLLIVICVGGGLLHSCVENANDNAAVQEATLDE